jgi:integrase
LRDVATFAYITGWRVPSEVLTLKWRQVDLAEKTVRLDPGSTKNDEGRLFPYGAMADLAAAVKSRRTATDAWQDAHAAICPWVFHRDGASLLDASGRPTKDFRDDWKAACKAAGCPGKIPHDFRRTAVRNLVRAGVSEKTAMLLTGHKTRSVFDRYDIVNEADLRVAVSKLAAVGTSTAADRRRSSKGRGQER